MTKRLLLGWLFLSGSSYYCHGLSTKTSSISSMEQQYPNDKRRRRPHSSCGSSPRSNDLFAMEFMAPPLSPVIDDDMAFHHHLPRHTNNINKKKKNYRDAPLPITYTNDPLAVECWLEQHLPVGGCTVGLDIEAVPSFHVTVPAPLRQVATVQIATPSHALVIQLAKASGRPSSACHDIIRRIVESPFLVKAGCALDDDLIRLSQHIPIIQDAPNRFDLGGLQTITATTSTEDASSCVTTTTAGLRTVTRQILGLELPKPTYLSRSNWGRVPLRKDQVWYAARDAWAAAAVMDQLSILDPSRFTHSVLLEHQQQQISLAQLVTCRQNRAMTKRLLQQVRRRQQQQQKQRGGMFEQQRQKQHAYYLYAQRLEEELNQYPPLYPERFQLFLQQQPLLFQPLQQEIIRVGTNQTDQLY